MKNVKKIENIMLNYYDNRDKYKDTKVFFYLNDRIIKWFDDISDCYFTMGLHFENLLGWVEPEFNDGDINICIDVDSFKNEFGLS